MKERFKQFLEEHFRKIAPTKAAMEYRKTLLVELLDREQELRIKGVTDDELIYNMAVSELGDIDQTLAEFENRQIKSGVVKRKASAVGIIAVAIVALLTVVYLIVGGVAKYGIPLGLLSSAVLLRAWECCSDMLRLNLHKNANTSSREFASQYAKCYCPYSCFVASTRA